MVSCCQETTAAHPEAAHAPVRAFSERHRAPPRSSARCALSDTPSPGPTAGSSASPGSQQPDPGLPHLLSLQGKCTEDSSLLQTRMSCPQDPPEWSPGPQEVTVCYGATGTGRNHGHRRRGLRAARRLLRARAARLAGPSHRPLSLTSGPGSTRCPHARTPPTRAGASGCSPLSEESTAAGNSARRPHGCGRLRRK